MLRQFERDGHPPVLRTRGQETNVEFEAFVSYLNLGGTFYYLWSILDGASRAIVHWEIR